MNKSSILKMAVAVIIAMTMLLCTACGQGNDEGDKYKEQGYGTSSAAQQVKGDTPVSSTYDSDNNSTKQDETDPYVKAMEYVTDLFNNVKSGDDTEGLFALESVLEESVQGMADEEINAAKQKMQNAKNGAKTRLENSTDDNTNSEDESDDNSVSSEKNSASEGDEKKNNSSSGERSGDNSMDLWIASAVIIFLISVLAFFYYQVVLKKEKSDQSNGQKKMSSPRQPNRSASDHQGKQGRQRKQGRGKPISVGGDNASKRRSNSYPEEGSRSTMSDSYQDSYRSEPQTSYQQDYSAAQPTFDEYDYDQSVQTPTEPEVSETAGFVFNEANFIARCNEIAKNNDVSARKKLLKELLTECQGRASFVYCLNLDDVINSPSTMPVFIDDDTFSEVLRFDSIIVPSPTVSSDRQKRNMSCFASVSTKGYISAEAPSYVEPTADGKYILTEKGRWTV